eukprot:gnl/TRDRNA2_/TRDRNA2_38195_c0_seq1.p1 gnl/TRDRNA2_/TRDRNA2_38195_c0~~gnl/TRDRNA2_/TRDRNA2_38195_c0_seq1.p1  ORF type:complete len:196 (+),score=47.51 gnl/TRDRNA2_/TRDRNA2_38195_c0_seq1:87-674(+)
MEAPNTQHLLHGQTKELTEKKIESKLVEFKLFPLSAALSVLMGCAFLYIGFSLKPLATCDEPWPIWYKVQGCVNFVQMLLSTLIMPKASKLAANEDIAKAEVYMEQGRTQEAMESQMKGGMEVSGDVMSLAKYGCIFMLVALFDVGWVVHGLVMYLNDNGCTKMTHYFACMVCFGMGSTIVTRLITMMLRKKIAS